MKRLLLSICMVVSFFASKAQNTTAELSGPLALSNGLVETILFEPGDLTGTLTGVGIEATFTNGSNVYVHANDLAVFVLDTQNGMPGEGVLQVGGYTQLVINGEKIDWTNGNVSTYPSTFSDTKSLQTPLVFSESSTYRVAVGNGNAMGSGVWESITITLIGLAETNASIDSEKKSKLFIYPNPSKEVLNVSYGNNTLDFVKIADVNGKIVKDIKSEGNLTQINISNLPKGVYVVMVGVDGKEMKEKFIKE